MMRSLNLALMDAANHRRRLEAQSANAPAYLYAEEPAEQRPAPLVAPQSDADDYFVISLNGDDA